MTGRRSDPGLMRLGILLPNDGKAASVVRRWRATGRTLTDLVTWALEVFEESPEFTAVVKEE